MPFQEPPQQGRTSRVAFTRDLSGRPVVLKRSVGAQLAALRREHRALCALHPLGIPVPEPLLYVEHRTSFGMKAWLVTQRWCGMTLQAALGADPGPARRAAILRDFGAALARLHARPPHRTSAVGRGPVTC
ncbi:phosphotransferase family protein [Deinococcus arenae]|uniref:phosphotransferase family protein n=1 Tax=Deinococcus arenae TaxID=1452751 RepID=UPI003570E9E9